MSDVLILLLLPFIQIGVSFYISVQILIPAIILLSPRVLKIIVNRWFFLGALVAVLMVIETTLFVGAENGDILASGRQGLILAIMLGMLRSPLVAKDNVASMFVPLITMIAAATIPLLVSQYYMLSRHVYFGLPQSWFVINFQTLPDELALLYSKIRPTGTFGEPSYLSMVHTVLIISLMPLWSKQRSARIAILLLAAGVLLSMSMLGVMVVTFLLMRIGLHADIRRTFFVVGVMVVVLIASSSYILDSRILGRIGNIFSGQDYSANARFLDPIRVMPDILSSYPIGVPGRIFRGFVALPGVDIQASELSHNALFNILTEFGWLGVPIIVLLLAAPRTSGMRIIVVVMIMQNGAMMSFDKIGILYVAVMLENSIRGRSRQLRSTKAGASRSYGVTPAE